MIDRDALVSLPKAHLHAHLEGCCSLSLWNKIASGVDPRFLGGNLDEFLDVYRRNQLILRERTTMVQVLQSVLQDAKNQGVWHLELYIPGAFENQLEFLVETAELARDGEVSIGLLCNTQRDWPYERTLSVVRNAVEWKNKGFPIIGISSAGPEISGGLVHLKRALGETPGSHDLLVVPHAGEIGAASDLWQALSLKPRRVAHGIRCVDDDLLMAYLTKKDICCDVATTSNKLTGATREGQYPLARMIRNGVPCTLNADDSLIFGVDILDEYETALQNGLELADIVQLARNSFLYAVMPESNRMAALQAIEEWTQKHVDKK